MQDRLHQILGSAFHLCKLALEARNPLDEIINARVQSIDAAAELVNSGA